MLSLQLCPTLGDPMNYSPPGSSVHGILQARILEWVAMPSSGDLPNSGIKPESLMSPALAGRFYTTSATWKPTHAHTHTHTHTHLYIYTHTHNGILLSHKKEWKNAICSNLDGPRDYHIKWSQTENKIIGQNHVESKNNDIKSFKKWFIKQK